jgi:hypothetical protein
VAFGCSDWQAQRRYWGDQSEFRSFFGSSLRVEGYRFQMTSQACCMNDVMRRKGRSRGAEFFDDGTGRRTVLIQAEKLGRLVSVSRYG